MGRPGASERLERLLAVVPWIVARDGPTIDQVCARFDMSEADLLADLDLVFCCGVHPFTPDALIDVVVDEGRVWISYADYFDRPLRLTPEEGLALVAAGSALKAVPGADPAGPLARAIEKIAGVLGLDADAIVDVHLGAVAQGTLDTLRRAVDEARQVEIDYYTYERDDRARRVVDPYAVYAAEGEWYLTAYCHRAEAQRRFRVDRVADLTVLESTFDPPAERPAPGVFDPNPDDPRVVLDLDSRSRWVAEQYPVEKIDERARGRLRVTLVAGERAWLERLLLRVGAGVKVVEGADGVAAQAAARLLTRYTAKQP
jgi:proteasome accessory factor C